MQILQFIPKKVLILTFFPQKMLILTIFFLPKKCNFGKFSTFGCCLAYIRNTSKLDSNHFIHHCIIGYIHPNLQVLLWLLSSGWDAKCGIMMLKQNPNPSTFNFNIYITFQRMECNIRRYLAYKYSKEISQCFKQHKKSFWAQFNQSTKLL